MHAWGWSMGLVWMASSAGASLCWAWFDTIRAGWGTDIAVWIICAVLIFALSAISPTFNLKDVLAVKEMRGLCSCQCMGLQLHFCGHWAIPFGDWAHAAQKMRKKEDNPCWHGPQTGLPSTHSHFKTLDVTQMWRGVTSNFKSSSDAHPLKESVLLLAASPGRAPVGQEYTASSGISEEKETNFQNLRFCTQQEFPVSLIWEMKNSRKH